MEKEHHRKYESNKVWCEDNPEKVKEYRRKYYLKHKGVIDVWRREYRQEHKGEMEEYRKRYRRENVGKINKDGKKWRAENIERMKEYMERWRENNPERVKMYSRSSSYRRRGRLKGKGEHSLKEWERLKETFNGCCADCGRQEPFADLWYPYLTEDHIIPLSKGGTDYIENIQPLCIECNDKKGNKINY